MTVGALGSSMGTIGPANISQELAKWCTCSHRFIKAKRKTMIMATTIGGRVALENLGWYVESRSDRETKFNDRVPHVVIRPNFIASFELAR